MEEIKNIEIFDRKEYVQVVINYPRANPIRTIEIGLCDVRASDDIRIHYDFERDGWVILQPRYYYTEIDESTYHEEVEWIESAFCTAWKYELEEEEKYSYKEGKDEQSRT